MIKLILTSEDGWRPFVKMGGYASKDNVVADTFDNSLNLSKEYAVMKLHGETSALFAGAAATAAVLYIFYKIFNWKRARMVEARQRAQNEGRPAWGNNQGRIGMEGGGALAQAAMRLPVVFRPSQPPATLPRAVQEDEYCEECREEASREVRGPREEPGYDVLRGHFRPLPPLI